MRPSRMLVCSTLAFVLGSMTAFSQSKPPAGPVLYEGARLIIGDASAPIEDGAFVVQGGVISAVGKKGAVAAPAGASRVDLTGKTVMPAMVNIHSHVGYERFTTAAGESRAENFTRDNLIDHLQRLAFYGVGTVNDGGSAPLSRALPFLAEQSAGNLPVAAQLLLMAGIVPPDGGPDHILIQGTQAARASYEVVRAPEARTAVQDVAAKNVKRVKIWLGDRNGEYPAMPHEVYDAVIDEARKHGIQVHSHATSLRDQKDALRAGADVLVHTIQNAKVDEELAGLLKEKRPYWTPVMGLGDRSEVCDNDPFFDQALTQKVIADIRATDCGPRPNAAAREETLKFNFMKMIESGARIVLGTDVGIWPRYSFGQADHHEIRRYVQLGLTPAQAIVAATSSPAKALGLDDVGVLAAGKKADFIVLNANPLDDIANTRQIAGVYLRGTQVDRKALLARWKSGNVSP